MDSPIPPQIRKLAYFPGAENEPNAGGPMRVSA
jgi:hypothetical protein